jgi:predicted metal-binding membrane protein
VMMVAMMLPSLVPALLSYRESVGRAGAARPDCLTALVGVGYFAVWAAFGLSIFPLGIAVADVAMREPELSRTVPIVIGVAVLMAGVVQQTGWKARHLAFCREAADGHLAPYVGVGAAWRHGLHLGLRCAQSCIGLTVVVLALGMMDLRVMAVVGAAITAERLAPNGRRVSRAIGVIGVAVGLLAIARAAGLGLG